MMEGISQLLPEAFNAGLSLVMFLVFLAYHLGLVVYRLFFAPLAGFPGPKIAAVTGLYEFYYDYVKNGSYLYRIEQMHRDYGPIVRVNPEELSIDDADFYNEIYVVESKRRTDNYHAFAKGLGFDDSHFITDKHDLHRRRRKPLEPFFSRAGVRRLTPMLNDCARRLLARLEQLKGTDTIVRLDHVFAALTGDVMRNICTESDESYLDDPNFSPEWYTKANFPPWRLLTRVRFNTLESIALSMPIFVNLPLLIRIVALIPKSILLWAFPGGNAMMSKAHILDAKRAKEQADAGGGVAEIHTSIFRHVMSSDMPESEKSTERLSREAQILLGGGSVTTGRLFDFISYYIMANDNIRGRLSRELRHLTAGFPEQIPTFDELEKLPYMHAVIKEGLRQASVGMSAYFMHSDPKIYPEPDKFIPDRWLGDYNPLMDRNWVPFTKGSRQCLGMHLATAELYIVLACIFRPGGPKLELFETDETDVKLVHDFMLPLPKLDSKGLRVMVK
ncbi:uncharacterized protein KY384_003374 [Bacidia gigantensis]|uniref:uncharacterized protein n=1 Tax=Bacidia gigantensis TaxID=2732470 RepID=UPI001D044E55|nr:uncharacterized protein KY384_003374 [Bacidia gigantensis]KAG8531742.1 hypothetical protein KY384_003374 [Bacidia gigantensis]